MKFLNQFSYFTKYTFVLSLLAIIFFCVGSGLSVLAFFFSAMSLFLSSLPYKSSKQKVIALSVLAVFVAVLLYVSLLRVTLSVGYAKYTPSVLSIPFSGILVLLSFYFRMVSKDELDIDASKENQVCARRANTLFLMALFALVGVLFSYVFLYHIEPALAFVICVATLFDLFSCFPKKNPKKSAEENETDPETDKTDAI